MSRLALVVPCCFRTMLFSNFATSYCHALLLLCRALLWLHLATNALMLYYSRFFVVHTYLPFHCCPTITPCYLPFSGTFCPPPPLLFCYPLSHLVVLLCLTYSSLLSCVGGRAWSNTNKLHPITKVFFFF